LEVSLDGKLDEEGLFPLLVLVTFTTLIPPGTAVRALPVSLGEGDLAGLAVLVDTSFAVRAAKEAQELVGVLWESARGKEEAQELKEVVKGGLGEVGDQVEDEEAADGVLVCDWGSLAKWFITLEEVTQQRGFHGIIVIILEKGGSWAGL